MAPSAATDWRDLDADAYLGWQLEHGANVISCQAWTFSGYATYSSELGPRLVGAAGELLPRVYAKARARGLPIQSYVSVGADLAVCATRPHWLVPGSQGIEILGDVFPGGFLAPETAWTDLLCDRLAELLGRYPVDWLLCDWFCYGTLLNDGPVPRTPAAEAAFVEILGRGFPESPDGPGEADRLAFKRGILARQFRRIRDTVKAASPGTGLLFNVPFFEPASELWREHPMLVESDGLFAETSNADIVEWLLAIRRPDQRVFTTVYGRPDDHVEGRVIRWTDPSMADHWTSQGCDLFAYAFPVPPRAEPHPEEGSAIEVIADAYRRSVSRGVVRADAARTSERDGQTTGGRNVRTP